MPQDGIPPSPRQPAAPALRRRPVVASAVVAVVMFVACEAMFFAGLISAFLIVKAGIKPGMWPPPWQPRLPVEATAVNSAILIVSGALLLLAGFKRGNAVASKKLYVAASALGLFFVCFQGFEWTQLIAQGLTMVSSNHGAFFYLLVGTHALHVVAGLAALVWGFNRLRKDMLSRDQLRAVQIFWSFVVALWPVLYVLVYL